MKRLQEKKNHPGSPARQQPRWEPGRLSQQPRSGGEGAAARASPRGGEGRGGGRGARPTPEERRGSWNGGGRRGEGSRAEAARAAPPAARGALARGGRGGRGFPPPPPPLPVAFIAAPPPPAREGLPLPHHNKARAPPPRAGRAAPPQAAPSLRGPNRGPPAAPGRPRDPPPRPRAAPQPPSFSLAWPPPPSSSSSSSSRLRARHWLPGPGPAPPRPLFAPPRQPALRATPLAAAAVHPRQRRRGMEEVGKRRRGLVPDYLSFLPPLPSPAAYRAWLKPLPSLAAIGRREKAAHGSEARRAPSAGGGRRAEEGRRELRIGRGAHQINPRGSASRLFPRPPLRPESGEGSAKKKKNHRVHPRVDSSRPPPR
ncbi:SMAD family member 2 SMAD2 transcript variant X5 mRNA [Crotalus adamanteus]|uniref:SMAD family member 2 SMAD2 transcript variant X5 mRNA n=1 Tax=Crotalus adamanteus TaxID=8729 RepID=A0AAW1C368_CROAD